jgi:DNA-binding response OmpR family regulator
MSPSTGSILIVDDDPNVVDILTLMLTRQGYRCVSASDGPTALAKLEQGPVDVILLDVMMPVMDGLQVCERLRADERLKEIPVILVTAKDDVDTRARGMRLGVSEYLTKPINRQELVNRIEAQLHARALGRALTQTAAALEDPPKAR